ncbi:MAG: DUF805 domain-containing protein [Endomicrobium sp.]|jgi:uncharacterized membrane protein YhaH (DUF805 family)|nr:DUF805 domain-containing protein [Endomicrobium sp.]
MIQFFKVYFWDVLVNHYADFEGRASLSQFWYFVLINFVLGMVLYIIPSGILNFLVFVALLMPSIAIATRRLHDTNRSGWLQLVGLIPFVGWIILIVFLSLATVAPNKFDKE